MLESGTREFLGSYGSVLDFGPNRGSIFRDINRHSVVHLRLEYLTMYTLYLSKCINMHFMPQNESQQISFVLSDSSEKTEVKSNAKS